MGADHTCGFLRNEFNDNTNTARCFSGLPSAGGERDAVWLEDFAMSGPFAEFGASFTAAESLACFLTGAGEAVCATEPGLHMGALQVVIPLPSSGHTPRASAPMTDQPPPSPTPILPAPLLQPPAPLQPERIDLVERGTRLVHVECAGKTFRNNSEVGAGTQWCCGLDHHGLVSCWGVTPPHPVAVNASNATAYYTSNVQCVEEDRYLRDFGLRYASPCLVPRASCPSSKLGLSHPSPLIPGPLTAALDSAGCCSTPTPTSRSPTPPSI